MEMQVELLSILLYKDKNGGDSCRVAYRPLETKYCENAEKFKGYGELSLFIKGRDVFDKVPAEYCGTALTFIFEEKQSYKNPLRKNLVLKGIKNQNGKDLCVL